MALPGVSITCAFAGGDGDTTASNGVLRDFQLSEEPSICVAITNGGRRLVGLHVETPEPKRRWLWRLLIKGWRLTRMAE
ncbi:hypothetical protein [Ciceribacter sp. L1K22]|uniref:hypothetical protein n=1 Tax=Ciceribacter sp. L1K22 TaxID=2820275 RepID=UPI001ABDAD5D|nr:hypothetical protein [Ciceribacter sp. L1K22]MBO3760360.1 hypothetical protein [Ciceribacter sp. L1K22]